MKVIDLLNKIANGEDVPKEIIYNDEKLIFDNKTKDYIYESGYEEYWTDHFIINFDLNKEIKIIEEDKKIEKLGYCEEHLFVNDKPSYLTLEERRLLDSNFKELGNKINELIEEIKKLKGKSE